MPAPTVRVFVSSTWLDLEPEREAVEAAIQRMRETKFVGMEYFGSRDETTRRASLDEVDRSEVYVGIFGARYGSGITEAEYRRAREHKLPCFIYFKGDPIVLPETLQEDAGKVEQLRALKAELQSSHTVSTFTNPDNLATKVVADLHNWLFDKYLKPKLEVALNDAMSRGEAQALLSAVRDKDALGQPLLSRLQVAGYNVTVGDVVGRDKVTNIYNALPTAFSARHQLRAPVGDFVGRAEEIAKLTDALRSGGSAGISGISGMGGIGKTELALYVADQLRDAYPDAQLFVDMRGTDERPREAADALAVCVRAFVSLEQKLPEGLEDLMRLYRDCLDGKRALVVLDNARDASQVRPLLPPPGSALLVTSRDAIPLPGMRTRITLEQLRPAEARTLLTGIAPRVAETVADQICYLCGYLPLAVRAAGSLLDITADLDPADYIEQLRDERTRLECIGTEGVDLDVAASMSLSYKRLSPDGARVFRQLAVFPASFDAEAEEAICEDLGHKHLSDLLRRNLVLYDADTARYRLHDLVRLFAATRMSEEERSRSQTRHAGHYLNVLREANKLYKQGGETIKRGLALLDSEWRNIQAGQEWASRYASSDEVAAVICEGYPDSGAYLLHMRQHPRERILWLKAALESARQLKHRNAEANRLGNLGIAYAHLGEMRSAIEYFEKTIAVHRKLNDRQGEAASLCNLGAAHNTLGEWQRGIKFLEQALYIFQELGDRRSEGVTLGNLGNAYVNLNERGRAIQLYEQAITIHREIGNRDGEARDLGNLGTLYAVAGERQYAIELFKQQLAIASEIGDRRNEGIALFNIGLSLDKLSERAGAIAYAEAALESLVQIESPHVEMVRAQIAQWRGQE